MSNGHIWPSKGNIMTLVWVVGTLLCQICSDHKLVISWGRGNTAGATGCPGVFIPTSSTAGLDLSYVKKLLNVFMGNNSVRGNTAGAVECPGLNW